MPWLMLGLAIGTEVFGTVMLKASAGFTKFWPGVGVVVGYALAFIFLAQALKTIGVGTAYAIWSGVGTVGVVIAGMWLFGEVLNAWAIVGITLIIVGVVVLNVAAAH